MVMVVLVMLALDANGESPLHIAIRRRHAAVAVMLVTEFGASMALPTAFPKSQSALHLLAAIEGDAADDWEVTLLAHARALCRAERHRQGNADACVSITEADHDSAPPSPLSMLAAVNQADGNGFTPLHLALKNRRYGLAEAFLSDSCLGMDVTRLVVWSDEDDGVCACSSRPLVCETTLHCLFGSAICVGDIPLSLVRLLLIRLRADSLAAVASALCKTESGEGRAGSDNAPDDASSSSPSSWVCFAEGLLNAREPQDGLTILHQLFCSIGRESDAFGNDFDLTEALANHTLSIIETLLSFTANDEGDDNGASVGLADRTPVSE